jgi:hypothetical protein
MAAKPVNGRCWRKVPLLCVEAKLSVSWGKWRQAQQQNIFDLSCSGLGKSKHIASTSYYASWLELSTGFCATWVGTHQAKQASLHLTVVHWLSWIQGLTLNTRCHGFIIADLQDRNEVTWSPSHLLIWHHLFSSHQGTLTKEISVGWNCLESCVSWGSYFYEFRHKAIFLSKKSSWCEEILWLTEWVPGVHLVTRN